MNQKKSLDSVKAETSKEHPFEWPLSRMKRERFKKGDVLFKVGDTANKMYYIQKGSIRLIETDIVIGKGEVIGEMGIFSPFTQRTASAVCEEDLEAYTMESDDILNLFSRDPSFGLKMIRLSIGRFIEDLKRETEARERIASELRIAAEIQTSMLPRRFPPFPERKEIEIFAMSHPAKEVGGDFYDFFFTDKNRLYFGIGDVSGKGVPAALFMAITKTILKTEALRGLSSKDILDHINNILCLDNETGMFVTIFCAILDLGTGELQFSNAGHNPPLVCGSGECFEFMDVPKGFVAGAIENSKCGSGTLTLRPGDIIFLYTDGVTEAMNPEGELFCEERLKSCLANLQLQNKDVTWMVNEVRQEILNFTRGAPQYDDITMLALKYHGKDAWHAECKEYV
jgi:sigma-B regulation protein RsbU (phosphoserine phosphatase)